MNTLPPPTITSQRPPRLDGTPRHDFWPAWLIVVFVVAIIGGVGSAGFAINMFVLGDDRGGIVEDVGDCLWLDDGTLRYAEPIGRPVECGDRHDGEVVYANPNHFWHDSDARYPGDDELGDWAWQDCIEELDRYTDSDYDTSVYDVTYIYPGSESWYEDGDRGLICVGRVIFPDSGATKVVDYSIRERG